MGPLPVNPGGWLPVEPADQTTNGDLILNSEKDRRERLAQQRRRKEQEGNPDADEFQHRPEASEEL